MPGRSRPPGMDGSDARRTTLRRDRGGWQPCRHRGRAFGCAPGCETLLLTQNLETLGQMSCNPAFGGIGKGPWCARSTRSAAPMARAVDRAGYPVPHAQRQQGGPAVRATTRRPTGNCTAVRSARCWRTSRTCSCSSRASDLVVEGGRVGGVVTVTGIAFEAPAWCDRRLSSSAAASTSAWTSMPVVARRPAVAAARRAPARADAAVGRLKTGTPPRIDGRSVDFSVMQPQYADDPLPVFSFWGAPVSIPGRFLVSLPRRTSAHEIIRAGCDRSPMYHRAHRGRGSTSPVGRGQDPPLRRQGLAPCSSSRRTRDPRTASRPACPTTCRSSWCAFDPGLRARAPDPARLRDRVRLLRPARPEADARDPLDGLYFARADQRHHRGTKRPVRRAWSPGANAGQRALSAASPGCRRAESYLGVLVDDLTTRAREPYRDVHQPRRAPPAAVRRINADLRLTPTGARSAWSTTSAGRCFERKRDAADAEVARAPPDPRRRGP